MILPSRNSLSLTQMVNGMINSLFLMPVIKKLRAGLNLMLDLIIKLRLYFIFNFILYNHLIIIIFWKKKL